MGDLNIIAEVSRAGYYNYLKVKNNNDLKEVKNLVAKESIMKVYHFKKAKKGFHSIKMMLENEFGILYNRKKIQRIMRKYAILCPIRKSNPYKCIVKATKEHRVVPNLLQRFFKQKKTR